MDDTAFRRLSSRLQQGIAHNLGWASLRPVQDLTINAVMDGKNCIVLAPTAGGKTEAAFFPVLDRIYQEHYAPVSALYISPIRTLLNNQEQRLNRLAGLVGLTCFKWHGDVSQSERQRFLRTPDHILLTTPESLEVMLISPKIDTRNLFSDLRFIVIDEIHHFASDDRGAHPMAIIERLKTYIPYDIQRIGLSATVGNPNAIADWMQGSSSRTTCVIQPPGEKIQRLIRIDTYSDDEELSQKVAPFVRGRKTLFFVEGRKLAEGVKQSISRVTPISYVHHSSIGRELREEAEQSFMEGQGSQCIVCTSTMELGIDVGDLDAVLQLDAPGTVSSFMQRMGRTGRRAGSQTEINFFCNDEMALLRAIALVNLAKKKWIESITPTKYAIHILAHQILAQALQNYGVRRDQVWETAEKVSSFKDITKADFDLLLNHLVATDILQQTEGLFALGKQGEKQFGRQNFLSLYSVFETPEEMKVVTQDRRIIGTLQTWFVVQVSGGKEFVFTLAGKVWAASAIDFDRNEIIVRQAPSGAIPRWESGSVLIGREIVEEIREVLRSTEDYPFLTRSAKKILTNVRASWRDLVGPENIPVRRKGMEWEAFTFAGDKINIFLAQALTTYSGLKATGDSIHLRVRTSDSSLDFEKIFFSLLQTFMKEAVTTETLITLTSGLSKGRYSKFQQLLPRDQEARYLAEKFYDLASLHDWINCLADKHH